MAIRTIGLVERVGSLRVTGHRFRPERFNGGGALTGAGTTGISERFDYVLDGGDGGPLHLPGSQPWGARDAAVRDPAGSLVRIEQA